MDAAKKGVTAWVAALYNRLAIESFSGYYSRSLSEAETKVHFTRNLAINFSLMAEYFWKMHTEMWEIDGEDIVEHF